MEKMIHTLFSRFKKKSLLEKVAYLFVIIGLFTLVWFLSILTIDRCTNTNSIPFLEGASRIGDFIGGLVGVFFTLVGVFLLFENLSLQRKELTENRNLILQQQFESTFFSLLNSQRQITNELFLPSNYPDKISGRRFFDYVSEETWKIYIYISEKKYLSDNENEENFLFKFVENYAKTADMDGPFRRHEFIRQYFSLMEKVGRFNSERKILKETYFLLFKYYHPIYGHYFRNLYHILKFIHKNEVEECARTTNNQELIYEKYKGYSDIVQAQLSSFELFLLFFNGLCFEEMKKLIHYYNFLENLAVEDLIKDEHVSQYSDEEIGGIKYRAVNFKRRREIVQ
jgi:hypothetical protein